MAALPRPAVVSVVVTMVTGPPPLTRVSQMSMSPFCPLLVTIKSVAMVTYDSPWSWRCVSGGVLFKVKEGFPVVISVVCTVAKQRDDPVNTVAGWSLAASMNISESLRQDG